MEQGGEYESECVIEIGKVTQNMYARLLIMAGHKITICLRLQMKETGFLSTIN